MAEGGADAGADAAGTEVAVPGAAASAAPVTSFSFKTSSGKIDAAVQEVLQRQGTQNQVAIDESGSKGSKGKAAGRGRGGAGSSAGGRPSRQKQNCMLCDLPRKGGSFCAEHKKAYDVVYRAATGPGSKDRPSGADDDDSDVEDEWDYELDMWVGSEQHSFILIFGDEAERKLCAWRQPAMAAKILTDVVALGASTDGAQGGKRKVRKHAVTLGQYLHAEGFRQSSDHIDGVRKVDEEFYTNYFKSFRGWDDQRCKNLWVECKADGQYGSDQKGPPWSKERLWLPSAWFGDDKVEERKGAYEDKQVNRHSKPGSMNDDDYANIKSEAGKGFKRPFSSNDIVPQMHAPLPVNALTAPGDDKARMQFDSRTSLRAAAGSLKSNSKRKSSGGGGGGDTESPSKILKDGKPASAQEITDLKTERNQAWRTMTSDMSKMKAKMVDIIKDADIFSVEHACALVLFVVENMCFVCSRKHGRTV